MCNTTKSVKGVTYNTNMCTWVRGWVRGCGWVGGGGGGGTHFEHLLFPPNKPTNVMITYEKQLRTYNIFIRHYQCQ